MTKVLPAFAVTVATAYLAFGQAIRVDDFGANGLISWTNSWRTNGIYRIEAASAVNGAWSSVPDRTNIIAASSRIYTNVGETIGVSSYFRVIWIDGLIADSYDQFANAQGENNWYYGYYDGDAPSPFSPGDFEPMTNSSGIWSVKLGTYSKEWAVSPVVV